MTSAEVIEAHAVARAQAERRLRRLTWVERVMLVAGALAVIALAVVSVVSISLDLANANAQRRSDCKATITGSVLGHALGALAAPPVPVDITPADFAKTRRGIEVNAGLADAEKLKHPNRYCR